MQSLDQISSKQIDITDALLPSTDIYYGLLAANTEQTVSVPTGAEFVIFTATNDYYVNYDLTASVPTGTISQAGGELNPILRYIGETSIIHIISPYTAYSRFFGLHPQFQDRDCRRYQ